MMTEEELTQQKEISYFQTLLSAYTENSFEKDKSLLTLSSGAIGLLITLLSTVGVKTQIEFILYVLTFVMFGACIVCLLYIFQANKKYLLMIANKEKIESNRLINLDRTAFVLFVVGIILFFAIGVSSASNQLTKKENPVMSNEEKNPKRVDESVEGLHKVMPKPDAIKSLDGLENMKPVSTPTQTSKPTVPAKPAPKSSESNTTSEKK